MRRTAVVRPLRRMIARVSDVPCVSWLILGFAFSYGLWFLRPVFLNGGVMSMPVYLPVEGRPSIGGDLQLTLDFSKALFTQGSPYASGWGFPPLTAVLFAPLMGVRELAGSFSAYLVGVSATLAALVWVLVILPRDLFRDERYGTVLTLVGVSALVSYGFQFELERGQFHLVAVALALAAVWLFHRRPQLRLVAYGLLVVSTHLKMYPIVFALLMVDDWDSWGANLRRWTSLALANAVALFVLGPGVFVDFMRTISGIAGIPRGSALDHSLNSFTGLIAGYAATHDIRWLANGVGAIKACLVACVIAAVLIVVVTAARRGDHGMNPYLLLVCALAACLLTPESYDYKLTILFGPMTCFLIHVMGALGQRSLSKSLLRGMLLFLAGVAYSSTLFSYAYKTVPLSSSASAIVASNTPALLVLLAVAVLTYVTAPEAALAIKSHGTSCGSNQDA